MKKLVNEHRQRMEEIERLVITHFRTTKEVFRQSKERKTGTFYRQVFYYLSYRYAKVPYFKIGSYIDRDHTTIIHGVNALQDRIDSGDISVAFMPVFHDSLSKYNPVPELSPVKNYFGENIYNMRLQKGWGRVKVSKVLHISRTTLERYEKGLAVPDILLFAQICKLYNVLNWRHLLMKKIRHYHTSPTQSKIAA